MTSHFFFSLCRSIVFAIVFGLLIGYGIHSWGSKSGAGGHADQVRANVVPGDRDGDGMTDAWETQFGLDPDDPLDAFTDFDDDHLTALQEFELHEELIDRGNSQKLEAFDGPFGSWSLSRFDLPGGPIRISRTMFMNSNGEMVAYGRDPGFLHYLNSFSDNPVWVPIASGPSAGGMTGMRARGITENGVVYGSMSHPDLPNRGFTWSVAEGARPFDAGNASVSPSLYPVAMNSLGNVVLSDRRAVIDGEIISKEVRIEGISHPRDAVWRDISEYNELIGQADSFEGSAWSTILYANGYTYDSNLYNTGPDLLLYDESGYMSPEYDFGRYSAFNRFGEYVGYTQRFNQAANVGLPEVFFYDGEALEPHAGGWPGAEALIGADPIGVSDHRWVAVHLREFGPEGMIDPWTGGRSVSYSDYAIWQPTRLPSAVTGLPSLTYAHQLIKVRDLAERAGQPFPESAQLTVSGITANGIIFGTVQETGSPLQIFTLANLDDTDGDEIPDDWELAHNLNPSFDDAQMRYWHNDALSNLGAFRQLRAGQDVSTLTALEGPPAPAPPSLDERIGIDSDGDHLPNVWEWAHGLNPFDPADAVLDLDRDGANNLVEFYLETDPAGAPRYRALTADDVPGLTDPVFVSAEGDQLLIKEIKIGESAGEAFFVHTLSGLAGGHAAAPVRLRHEPGAGPAPEAYQSLTGDSTILPIIKPLRISASGRVLGYRERPEDRKKQLAVWDAASGELLQVSTQIYSWIYPIDVDETGDHWLVRFSPESGGPTETRLLDFSKEAPAGDVAASALIAPNQAVGLTSSYVGRPSMSNGFLTANSGWGTSAKEIYVPLGAAALEAGHVLSAVAGTTSSQACGVLRVGDEVFGVSEGRLNTSTNNGRRTAVYLRPLAAAAGASAIEVTDGQVETVSFVAAAGSHLLVNATPVPGQTTPARAATVILNPADRSVTLTRIEPVSEGSVTTGLDISASGEVFGQAPVSRTAKAPWLHRGGKTFALEDSVSFNNGLGVNVSQFQALEHSGALMPYRPFPQTTEGSIILLPVTDTDGDGMSDEFELSQLKLNPYDPADGLLDPDLDGLTSSEEAHLGTHPVLSDTDRDRMKDGWEVEWGLNPLSAADANLDPDGDFLPNVSEHDFGSAPTGRHVLTSYAFTADEAATPIAFRDDGLILVSIGTGSAKRYELLTRVVDSTTSAVTFEKTDIQLNVPAHIDPASLSRIDLSLRGLVGQCRLTTGENRIFYVEEADYQSTEPNVQLVPLTSSAGRHDQLLAVSGNGKWLALRRNTESASALADLYAIDTSGNGWITQLTASLASIGTSYHNVGAINDDGRIALTYYGWEPGSFGSNTDVRLSAAPGEGGLVEQIDLPVSAPTGIGYADLYASIYALGNGPAPALLISQDLLGWDSGLYTKTSGLATQGQPFAELDPARVNGSVPLAADRDGNILANHNVFDPFITRDKCSILLPALRGEDSVSSGPQSLKSLGYRNITARDLTPNGLLILSAEKDGQPHLLTLANEIDRDANGLADDWQAYWSLILRQDIGGAYGDFDEDGYPNWQEMRAGADPTFTDPAGSLPDMPGQVAPPQQPQEEQENAELEPELYFKAREIDYSWGKINTDGEPVKPPIEGVERTESAAYIEALTTAEELTFFPEQIAKAKTQISPFSDLFETQASISPDGVDAGGDINFSRATSPGSEYTKGFLQFKAYRGKGKSDEPKPAIERSYSFIVVKESSAKRKALGALFSSYLANPSHDHNFFEESGKFSVESNAPAFKDDWEVIASEVREYTVRIPANEDESEPFVLFRDAEKKNEQSQQEESSNQNPIARYFDDLGHGERYLLLYMDLSMDLNNDGLIGDEDTNLRNATFETGATEEDIDRGTEYLFLNDNISNGLWDREDPDPDKPVGKEDDDDAQEIKIVAGITEGEIWLEHPAINGLAFYKTRECKAADKVNLSPNNKFSVSYSNPFPDQLFVRAEKEINFPDSDNPQVEGDLVLKIKSDAETEEIELLKMKLTVVKELGAKNFFESCRDYIFENNTKLFTKELRLGSSRLHMNFMLEESSSLFITDIFDHKKSEPRIKGGIDEITISYPASTVILSGNFCWATRGNTETKLNNLMTDRCDGRIALGAHILRPVSSDDHTPYAQVFPELGSDLGCFISCDNTLNGKASWNFGTRKVEASDKFSMGGLASNYSTARRNAREISVVGRGLTDTDGKGIIFTASSPVNGSGNSTLLADKLVKSGTRKLAGSQIAPNRYELLFLDGGTSVGMANVRPNGNLKTIVKGGKQFPYNPGLNTNPFKKRIPGEGLYRINTHLIFNTEKPRLIK